MKYDITAIPTRYKGRQYRSMLEARWAAMFDLLKWKNEYEPFELPGWIPDFVLFGKEKILVEVKPFTEIEEWQPTIAKILKAVEEGNMVGTEILLLGCTIFEHSKNFRTSYVGWLGDSWGTETPIYQFEPATINHYDTKWGFFHDLNSWEDRMTGKYDGNKYVTPPTYEEIQAIWNQAGNIVQWSAPAKEE